MRSLIGELAAAESFTTDSVSSGVGGAVAGEINDDEGGEAKREVDGEDDVDDEAELGFVGLDEASKESLGIKGTHR